jgi:hypothetical protein
VATGCEWGEEEEGKRKGGGGGGGNPLDSPTWWALPCVLRACGPSLQLPDLSPAWLQLEAIKEGRREYVTAGLSGVGFGTVPLSGVSGSEELDPADVRARLGRELVRALPGLA